MTSSNRIWLTAAMRPHIAERRATRRVRIASTASVRVLASPIASPA